MLLLIFFSIELEDLLPSDSKEYDDFDDMENLLETPNLNSYLLTPTLNYRRFMKKDDRPKRVSHKEGKTKLTSLISE